MDMKNGNILVIANKVMVSKIANSSMKADITRIERIIRIANTSRIYQGRKQLFPLNQKSHPMNNRMQGKYKVYHANTDKTSK